MHKYGSHVMEKSLQYLLSIGGGLLAAFETSLPFFVPCLIMVLIDIWSALCLGQRLHKKYPEKHDGKFKSEYKFRVLRTMLVVLLVIICADYADRHVFKGSDTAVRFVTGVFFFYQIWSVLENWSSENDNKLARALQRIMVNKAERHLDVPLKDILLKEEKAEEE